MGKEFNKVIEKIELVKIERPVNANISMKYYYNIQLEGIDELLLVETPIQIPADGFIGSRIKYEIDENTNEVSNFNFQ